jgi:hypothetical protein
MSYDKKTQLPTLRDVKDQAKRLAKTLADQGNAIGHAKSLELIAKQYGFRNWNTFHAAIGNSPPEDWNIGDRVEGAYLSKSFKGELIGVELLSEGWFKLIIDLDEAVDVVKFDGFSNMRKRIRATIGSQGVSREKTSDGKPHLEIVRQ